MWYSLGQAICNILNQHNDYAAPCTYLFSWMAQQLAPCWQNRPHWHQNSFSNPHILRLGLRYKKYGDVLRIQDMKSCQLLNFIWLQLVRFNTGYRYEHAGQRADNHLDLFLKIHRLIAPDDMHQIVCTHWGGEWWIYLKLSSLRSRRSICSPLLPKYTAQLNSVCIRLSCLAAISEITSRQRLLSDISNVTQDIRSPNSALNSSSPCTLKHILMIIRLYNVYIHIYMYIAAVSYIYV